MNIQPFLSFGRRASGIVSANLAMHLDAGDAASYSGSGAAWNDLVGAYHWTKTGATFNGSAGGMSSSEYFSFDGASDYFDLTSAHSGTILRQMGKTTVDFTLEMWVYPVSAVNQMFFGNTLNGTGFVLTKSNTNIGSSTDHLQTGTNSGANLGNDNATHSNSAWHQIAFAGKFDGSATGTYYLDGAANGTRTCPTGFTGTDSDLVPRMGARPSDAVLPLNNGTRIAIARIYASILSDAAVAQNWTANRGRFGV